MSLKIFNNLEGFWLFHREVPGGSMEGKACFFKTSSSMYDFKEEGLLKLDGQTHQVYREYVYQLEENSIAIFFKEQPLRLFQRLDFTPSQDYPYSIYDIHHCGADSYRGVYTFVSSREFAVQQIVKGPCKNHQILTTFSKV